MDENSSQKKEIEHEPITPAISHDRVLQPSAKSIDEIKTAQAESNQAQQIEISNNQNQVPSHIENQLQPSEKNSSNIYPDPTKGLGSLTTTYIPPEPNKIMPDQTSNSVPGNVLNDDRKLIRLTKFNKKVLLILVIIIVFGLGYLILHSQFTAYISPGKDVITSPSDFQRYSLSNSTASLLFYKDSTVEPHGVIISPSLSGKRLPLKLGILNSGYFATTINLKCPINNQGFNTLDYTVYAKALNATIFICKSALNPGGGPYADNFSYFSNHQRYSGTITLVNGSSVSNYTRDNLNLYSTDIKTIVASIQPE